MGKFVLGACAALGIGMGLLGRPTAQAQDIPSYARQTVDDVQIRGRVTSFDGGYNVEIRDEKGYSDNVRLHSGTIINPTGLTLAPGMVVSVLGYNAGSYFAANEVDTPYTFSGGVPFYGGHPWGYYGPSVSLGFFFGNTGWWHGSYFYGGSHFYGGPHYGWGGAPYDRGYRVYDDVHVRNVYHNYAGAGRFRGRNFVAPPSAGGYRAPLGHERSATHNRHASR